MKCSLCGVSDVRERLFDAVSSKGIIRLCHKCAEKEDFPVLKKPTTFQLKDEEKRQGIPQPMIMGPKIKLPGDDKTETTLREIVDRNYETKQGHEKKPRPDLVDNFHWLIMRARRSKKLTQAQFAKEISESEAAIKMAEQGILPEDDYRGKDCER